MQKKVAIIIGTRPEAIKLIPVYLKFKEYLNHNSVILISTGQHKEMLKPIFSFFNVEPNIEMETMTNSQSLSSLSAKIMSEGDEVLKKNEITHVVVQGDTTTAMIFGLVSFYNRLEVIHVEAGLRTYNNYSPFPEEVNRKIISQFAAMHFCPTKKSCDALLKENIKENIFNVGNTVIDSLLFAKNIILNQLNNYENYFTDYLDVTKTMILITCHRRENFGDGLKNICHAIKQLAEIYPQYQFVYPVHLNPNIIENVQVLLNGVSNITLLSPLPYDKMVYLLMKSHIILTDSGGIQEEAPALNKPVIILRDTTERPEVIDAGCGILAGIDTDTIVNIFRKVNDDTDYYQGMINKKNPYGDGTTSKKIVTNFMEYYKFMKTSNE